MSEIIVGPLLFRLASVIIVLALSISHAHSGKRVALVIGNSGYTYAPELKNPRNDANAVADVLTRLGFEVIKGIDLNHDQFIALNRKFSRAIDGSEAALVFYAGHGLQVNGQNYLAPVDAVLSLESDVEFETVRIDSIITQMEREPRTNLIFLDACRDNPLARNLARSMGTRSASIGKGLTRIEAGIGTLVAFSTQPGNVALDGKSLHSPFTEALLKHIETPDLDVDLLLRRVREDVLKATTGKQVTWTNSSLTGVFMFATRHEVTETKPKLQLFPETLPPVGSASNSEKAWVKLCEKTPSITNPNQMLNLCLTHHERLDGNTGMVLVSAAIREIEGVDKKALMVMIPLGMAMPPGVQVRIDDNAPLKLPITLCHAAGCTAEIEASEATIEQFRKGNQLVVAAINLAGKAIGFPVPLNGFGEAYAGPPVDNQKYKEARLRLMQQIRQRQADAAKTRSDAATPPR
jgi:invasion protein IalB